MKIDEEPTVLTAVSTPHEGPISLLRLLGPTDSSARARVRQNIEKVTEPLLKAQRFLRDEAAIGIADPTVYH